MSHATRRTQHLHRRSLRSGAAKIAMLLIILNELRGAAAVAGVLWAWRPWE